MQRRIRRAEYRRGSRNWRGGEGELLELVQAPLERLYKRARNFIRRGNWLMDDSLFFFAYIFYIDAQQVMA